MKFIVKPFDTGFSNSSLWRCWTDEYELSETNLKKVCGKKKNVSLHIKWEVIREISQGTSEERLQVFSF